MTSVQVAIRLRPFNQTELLQTNHNGSAAIAMNPIQNTVSVGGTKNNRVFTFDHALSHNVGQAEVYRTCVEPLTASCLEGYNATVFAYGQTGSGKTYTMLGNYNDGTCAAVSSGGGIIPRAFAEIFEKLSGNLQLESYEIKLQYLELYGEEIRDLLSSTRSDKALNIRDHGWKNESEPEVVGASEVVVESPEEAMILLERGSLRRVTASTAMNRNSSRSHAILSVVIEQTLAIPNDSSSPEDNSDPSSECRDDRSDDKSIEMQVKRSKFNFVDLAGSERQKKTGASGERLKEGIDINKGLLALGNVISALGDLKKRGKTFVPYRDSKLTRLLKGSLGGNHKTLMIACISPAESNLDESLCCLRYANRAKNIQNNAVINVDAGSKKVAELREQVQVLAQEVLRIRDIAGGETVEVVFPTSVLKALANGKDVTASTKNGRQSASVLSSKSLPTINVGKSDIEYDRMKSILDNHRSQLTDMEEELYKVKAEKEFYRLKMEEASCSVDISSTEAIEEKSRIIEITASYEKKLSKSQKTIEQLKASQISNASPKQTGASEESVEVVLDIDEYIGQEEAKTNLYKDTEEYIGQEEAKTNPDKDADEHDLDTSFLRRQKTMDAHVNDLSKSITAKEELLNQLNFMQNRYEDMRIFYEEKLSKMEDAIMEKEFEFENLKRDLEQSISSKAGNDRIEALRMEIKLKEERIENLRIKQRELQNLTKVSSRNTKHIADLKVELVSMKRQRVELQKQIARERKTHSNELKNLKKQAMKLDREATRLRQESDKKSKQIESAQRLAKTRLEEIGRVRSRYRDTEKKLRMYTLKKGVMARAGVDPILTGHNYSDEKRNKSHPDPNKLRKFFDEKIAEVAKIEDAAKRLAVEWEEHMGLQLQKEVLEKDLDETDEEKNDEIESIQLQINLKEDEIRRLSSSLRQPIVASRGGDISKFELILNCKELSSINAGVPTITAVQSMVRVLFGMIVKERQRVVALARSASKLDEDILLLQKEKQVVDAALRAQNSEYSHERTQIANENQELILSLMSLVQTADTSKDLTSSDSINQTSVAMTLAQQRIVAMEQEISLLKKECRNYDTMKQQNNKLVSELESERREVRILSDKLSHMRGALRDKVPSADSRSRSSSRSSSPLLGLDITPPSKSNKEVHQIIKKALDRPISKSSESRKYFSSDSDDDLEEESIPEWADAIMSDLHIISEGGIPESMRGLNLDSNNVFERLANPHNFTGTQKHTKDFDRPRSGGEKRITLPVTTVISLNPRFPDEDELRSSKHSNSSNTTAKSRRSVYQRLSSPSNYTEAHKTALKQFSSEPIPPSEMLSMSSQDKPPLRSRPKSAGSKDSTCTKKNVFERLQHNVTASFAGKIDNGWSSDVDS